MDGSLPLHYTTLWDWASEAICYAASELRAMLSSQVTDPFFILSKRLRNQSWCWKMGQHRRPCDQEQSGMEWIQQCMGCIGWGSTSKAHRNERSMGLNSHFLPKVIQHLDNASRGKLSSVRIHLNIPVAVVVRICQEIKTPTRNPATSSESSSPRCSTPCRHATRPVELFFPREAYAMPCHATPRPTVLPSPRRKLNQKRLSPYSHYAFIPTLRAERCLQKVSRRSDQPGNSVRASVERNGRTAKARDGRADARRRARCTGRRNRRNRWLWRGAVSGGAWSAARGDGHGDHSRGDAWWWGSWGRSSWGAGSAGWRGKGGGRDGVGSQAGAVGDGEGRCL